jgi:NAD(P)-dependent dehydrogenase (short-subunit alcohol dehydrogenase family)
MASPAKTAIVTGASQGIGAGVVRLFLERGYNVVANSRTLTASGAFAATDRLALVDGDIGQVATAERIAKVAVDRFGGIDALVNNAGLFVSKPFLEYTHDDFAALVSTNLEGFIYMSQLAIKRMLAQGRGGSIVSITTSLVKNPIKGFNASVAMVTKGGLDAITRTLAIEYAKDHIRVNAVAPGIVDTPMHKDHSKDALRTFSPMGQLVEIQDIAEAVLYLTEAEQVTGEVLHVDAGAHAGRW